MLHAAYEPTEETIAAVAEGMRLLDLDNPRDIAGWREALTPDVLADVFGVDGATLRVGTHGAESGHDGVSCQASSKAVGVTQAVFASCKNRRHAQRRVLCAHGFDCSS